MVTNHNMWALSGYRYLPGKQKESFSGIKKQMPGSLRGRAGVTGSGLAEIGGRGPRNGLLQVQRGLQDFSIRWGAGCRNAERHPSRFSIAAENLNASQMPEDCRVAGTMVNLLRMEILHRAAAAIITQANLRAESVFELLD
ncbi:MAG: hypothetical protein ACOC7U_05765 [Spirochaetota bacterium]